jgi:hypothetical protein
MRNIFRQEVVDTTFSAALEKLDERTTDIKAVDLQQGYIEMLREEAAESSDVIELQHYGGDFSDEQWQENMEFDRFVELAKVLGKTSSSPFRVIPSRANRPFDYDEEEDVV